MGSFIQKGIDLSRGKTPRDELRARQEADAAKFAKENPEILLPDEEALRRQARRDLAGRAQIGGRLSTILTGRLGGPGGRTGGRAGGGSSSPRTRSTDTTRSGGRRVLER